MKPSEKFKNWIDRQIADTPSEKALPPERELARTFGISHPTVHRILREYGKAGKLVRIRGKGTFLPGAEPEPTPQPEAPLTSAQTLARALKKAVADGDIKKGDPLPQQKYLVYRFNVTAQTVMQAYRILEKEGLVEKIGKAYWVGGYKAAMANRDNRDIYLFVQEAYHFGRTFGTTMSFAYQTLEKELHKAGFRIRYARTGEIPVLAKKWEQHGFPAGIIVTRMARNIKDKIFGLLKRNLPMNPEERPPLLIDLMAKYNNELGKINILVRGHMLTTCADALGEFVRQKGYKKVYIFAHLNAEVWSVPGNIPLLRIAWLARDAGLDCEFRYAIAPRRSRWENIHDVRHLVIPKALQTYAARKFSSDDKAFAEGLNSRIRIVKNFRMIFESTYKESDRNTLWVFGADIEAVQALDWAKKKDINVPEQLSIMGLQHSPSVFHRGLSLCGPDWDTMGYQMAHALIGDLPGAKTRKGFIKTTARVIEKLTTR